MGPDGMSSDEEHSEDSEDGDGGNTGRARPYRIRQPYWRGNDANRMLDFIDTKQLEQSRKRRGKRPNGRTRDPVTPCISQRLDKTVAKGLPINFYAHELDTTRFEPLERLNIALIFREYLHMSVLQTMESDDQLWFSFRTI